MQSSTIVGEENDFISTLETTVSNNCVEQPDLSYIPNSCRTQSEAFLATDFPEK